VERTASPFGAIDPALEAAAARLPLDPSSVRGPGETPFAADTEDLALDATAGIHTERALWLWRSGRGAGRGLRRRSWRGWIRSM
jgi:hypothetical protein